MNEQVNLTQRQLDELFSKIANRVAINTKDVLTSDEASRSLGINGTSISSVCKGKPKRKTAGGFVWRYKKEHVPVTPSLSRPVQIFKNNILVGEWDSIKNCIKEHIIPRNRLKACLRGEENSWNGYYCRYKNKIDYSKK